MSPHQDQSHESLSRGAHRALNRARLRARERGGNSVDPEDLLAALADEPENRSSELIEQYGLDLDRLRAILEAEPWPEARAHECEAVEPGNPPDSPRLRGVLGEAAIQAKALRRPVETEQLLISILKEQSPAILLAAAAGLDVAGLIELARGHLEQLAGPLPIPTEGDGAPLLDLTGPSEAIDLARILDAAANRAGEGLRVVEDYVRFALDDPMLTKRMKDVRHRLAAATSALGRDELDRLNARDTLGDVGTHIALPSEQARENPRAVLIANFRRSAEALRTLEEFAKLSDVWLAGRFEVLRYDVYTLEKLTLIAVASHHTLGAARLCVLVGGLPTLGDVRWVVEEALAGGTQAIQLREKNLDDREVLSRAREIRLATIQAGARFFLNDRPDLARLAGADGVHLGQDDLQVRDARRILGPRGLIGVSTHDREQIERAVLDGAGYLGVGPVFASTTKEFTHLAGLALVRQAAETVNLPWFAIGGIDESNLDDVLDAGAERIAVSSAVVRAPSPRRAAAALRARLGDS